MDDRTETQQSPAAADTTLAVADSEDRPADNLRDACLRDGSVAPLDSGHAPKTPVPYTASPIKLRIRRAVNHHVCDAENQPPAAEESEAGSNSANTVSEQSASRSKAHLDFLEKSKPAKFSIGDMVWAKLTGHPWWPCMIWPDPEDSVCTRFTGKGGVRSYHCLFFGAEGERGWVCESFMLPYAGRTAFEKYAHDCISSATQKSQKKAAVVRFEIRQSRKHAWEMASMAADDAYKLSVEERKQQYALHIHGHGFPEIEVQSTGTTSEPTSHGRKRSQPSEARQTKRRRYSPTNDKGAEVDGSSTTGPAAATKPSAGSDASTANSSSDIVLPTGPPPSIAGSADVRVPHRHDGDNAGCCATDEGSPSNARDVAGSGKVPLNLPPGLPSYLYGHIPSPKKCKNPAASFFNSFVCKRTPIVKADHPEWTPIIIHQFLKYEWSKMSERQKAKFRVRPGKPGAQPEQFLLQQMSTSSEGSPSCGRAGVLNGVYPAQPLEFTVRLQNGSEVPAGSRKHDKRALAMADAGISSQRLRNRITITTSHLDALYSSPSPVTPSSSLATCNATAKPGGKVHHSATTSEGSQDSHADEGDRKGCRDLTIGSLAEPAGSDTSVTHGLEILKLSAAWSSKKELVCVTCEKVGGEMMTCQRCCTSFHCACIGMQYIQQKDFTCALCSSDSQVCFMCKKPAGESGLRKCAKAGCGKFYHYECLANNLLSCMDDKDKPICPLHICATCAEGNNRCSKASSGRFFTCIRCPVAYHVGDFCIAAGSAAVGGCNIICSNHYVPNKSRSQLTHVNVSWCFVCNRGGTLLCCDGCPAAFHSDCLGIPFPDGAWFCNDCKLGKKPLYGNLVWVKLGIYRWWPGEICHPRNVPRNIQDMSHGIGEFPIKFFGSHDYFWTHHARVFTFHEGDKGSRDATPSRHLARVFKKAVQEATAAFQEYKSIKEKKDQEELDRTHKKPPYWKYLKTNLPVGNVNLTRLDPDDLPHCECKPDAENPCGDDTCLNRMMMYECHPSTCPAGSRCQNQRFQKRRYPVQEPFFTNSARGWGLRTKESIKKGDFVNEYVGELIDEKECLRRMERAQQCNVSNFYMLTIDRNRIIDAGPKGNLARFMNHSCMPNLISQKWTVNGNIRVGLFAVHDIPAGTELTFNYNLDCLGNEKMACNCKTPVCSGFIGDRPKQATPRIKKVKVKAKPKPRRRRSRPSASKDHDECCFRCGEGGHLLLCDMAQCTKAYHIECLNRQRRPYGKWYCPRHFCVVCGSAATQQCSVCPNSFCMPDATEDKIKAINGEFVCYEHDDEESDSNEISHEDGEESSSGSTQQSITDDVNATEIHVAATDTASVPQKRKVVQRSRKPSSSEQQPEEHPAEEDLAGSTKGFKNDGRKRAAAVSRTRRAAATLVESNGKTGMDVPAAVDASRTPVPVAVA